MGIQDDNSMATGKLLAAAITTALPGAEVLLQVAAFALQHSYPQIGQRARTRFAEMQQLLTTGAVPRCLSNCDDPDNFLDLNMAGGLHNMPNHLWPPTLLRVR